MSNHLFKKKGEISIKLFCDIYTVVIIMYVTTSSAPNIVMSWVAELGGQELFL